MNLNLSYTYTFNVGLGTGHLDELIKGHNLAGTSSQRATPPYGTDYHKLEANRKTNEGDHVQVQMQEPKAHTCVSCATVNSLRFHGLDAPVEMVIEALKVKRFHGRDASFVSKAAKYLRREYGMDVVISRPPHLMTDRTEATLEVAYRFEAMLMQGYVGLLSHKETAKEGHAVVLHRIIRERGEPYFVCYDSNKRQSGGEWVYKVEDYLWWTPPEMDMKINLKDRTIETTHEEPRPTGRVGYFVRPGRQGNAVWGERSFFRARPRRPRHDRADGPPGG